MTIGRSNSVRAVPERPSIPTALRRRAQIEVPPLARPLGAPGVCVPRAPKPKMEPAPAGGGRAGYPTVSLRPQSNRLNGFAVEILHLLEKSARSFITDVRAAAASGGSAGANKNAPGPHGSGSTKLYLVESGPDVSSVGLDARIALCHPRARRAGGARRVLRRGNGAEARETGGSGRFPVAAQSVEDPSAEAASQDECAVERRSGIDRAAAERDRARVRGAPAELRVRGAHAERERGGGVVPARARARRSTRARPAGRSRPNRRRRRASGGCAASPSKSTKSGAGAGAGDDWPEGDATKRSRCAQKKAAMSRSTQPGHHRHDQGGGRVSPEEAAFEANDEGGIDELMRRMKEEQDAAARATARGAGEGGGRGGRARGARQGRRRPQGQALVAPRARQHHRRARGRAARRAGRAGVPGHDARARRRHGVGRGDIKRAHRGSSGKAARAAPAGGGLGRPGQARGAAARALGERALHAQPRWQPPLIGREGLPRRAGDGRNTARATRSATAARGGCPTTIPGRRAPRGALGALATRASAPGRGPDGDSATARRLGERRRSRSNTAPAGGRARPAPATTGGGGFTGTRVDPFAGARPLATSPWPRSPRRRPTRTSRSVRARRGHVGRARSPAGAARAQAERQAAPRDALTSTRRCRAGA